MNPQSFYRLLISLIITTLWLIAPPAVAATDPSQLARAVEAIEQVDQMRSGLAATLEGSSEEPTLQTMQAVCRPVGMQIQQLSQTNGWQIQQIARKYRNPAHAPDRPQLRMALAEFEQNPDLIGFWERSTLDGQASTRYYRRINVEAGCLVCHGSQSDRPQFVKDNYPQDLAYDFQIGDLRGMYAVFMPDLQRELQDAVGKE